jgi:putative endonuclease
MAKPIRTNRPATREKKGAESPAAGGWTLYIVECRDGTFYTGIAKDVGRRLVQHNEGSASRYTRSRRPVKIIYQEPCGNRSEASIKEAAVKSLSRLEKEKLIKRKKRHTGRDRSPQPRPVLSKTDSILTHSLSIN